MHDFSRCFNFRKQQGMALILVLLILVLGMTTLLAGSLNSSALLLEREQYSFSTLIHARDALIGDAVAQSQLTSAGYLRLPDLGFKIGNSPAEGSAAPNFSGNSRNFSVVGKLPWRTLGLEPLRDGQGECLWYAVSGHFKKTPATDALNWDTQGQINLIDDTGNIIAGNLAALVIAPGAIIDGQNRAISDPAYVQCGGNYNASNYLDPNIASDAVSGTVNYFMGSSNGRVALDSGDKQFLTSRNAHYNDRFLFISVDDIFHALMRRADFAAQVSSLLNDPYFLNVAVAGPMGTDNVNCTLLDSNNRIFCKNWKEMLLLTQLPAMSAVTIDGVSSGNCTRVLLFGGQKNTSQRRLNTADKTTPANYIEGINLPSFATPFAASSSFIGISTFNPDTPDADLLKCLS